MPSPVLVEPLHGDQLLADRRVRQDELGRIRFHSLAEASQLRSARKTLMAMNVQNRLGAFLEASQESLWRKDPHFRQTQGIVPALRYRSGRPLWIDRNNLTHNGRQRESPREIGFMPTPALSQDGPFDLPPSDHTLVECAKGGSEDAAVELYRRYAARLHRVVAERQSKLFAARFDPDDVVQSVFRILYQGLRSDHYHVPKGGELWGLLFVLAVNKVRWQIAHHRAAKRTVHKTTDLDDVPMAADAVDEAVLRLTVDDYLAGLPDADQVVVGLRMDGYSVAEIAARTGRALRSVERVLQRVRDQLAECLRT